MGPPPCRPDSVRTLHAITQMLSAECLASSRGLTHAGGSALPVAAFLYHTMWSLSVHRHHALVLSDIADPSWEPLRSVNIIS